MAKAYDIAFENGFKVEELRPTGTCGRRNTGTRVHFGPTPAILIRLTSQIQNWFICCGLKRYCAQVYGLNSLTNRQMKSMNGSMKSGLTDYLKAAIGDNLKRLPDEPFVGCFKGQLEAADWAITWLPEGGESIGGVMLT